MLAQREMIVQVADKSGLTQREAERVLRAAADMIAAEVAGGGQARFFDLGSFKAVARKARARRNPRTGETVQVPAHAVVKFAPSVMFKQAVAQGGAVDPALQSQAG